MTDLTTTLATELQARVSAEPAAAPHGDLSVPGRPDLSATAIEQAIDAEAKAWAKFFKITEDIEAELAQRRLHHRANLSVGYVGCLAEFLPPAPAPVAGDDTLLILAAGSTHVRAVLDALAWLQRAGKVRAIKGLAAVATELVHSDAPPDDILPTLGADVKAAAAVFREEKLARRAREATHV